MTADQTIDIRLCGPDDVVPLADAHVRSWQRHYAGILPEPWLRDLRPSLWLGSWSALTTDGRHESYLASVDGRPVGFTTVGPAKEETGPAGSGEIFTFYTDLDATTPVLPYRLMRAALSALRRRGLDPVRLWVLEDNLRARRYFSACGFVADGGERRTRIAETDLGVLRYVHTAPAGRRHRPAG
jgi:hypothetical protein